MSYLTHWPGSESRWNTCQLAGTVTEYPSYFTVCMPLAAVPAPDAVPGPDCLFLVSRTAEPALDTCLLARPWPAALALAGLRPPAANAPIAHPTPVTATAV